MTSPFRDAGCAVLPLVALARPGEAGAQASLLQQFQLCCGGGGRAGNLLREIAVKCKSCGRYVDD